MSGLHHKALKANSSDAANPEARLSEGKNTASVFRIAAIALDEHSVLRRTAEIEKERASAICDLLAENHFAPVGSNGGPYHLHLAIAENRLVFTIHLSNGHNHGRIVLSLNPFRRVVRDYFLICESYYAALREAPRARVEALDMSRRGLHNEGSALLIQGLKGKVDLDFETARRLFTLISVLHLKV
jgi:uncharacterized protein (UPF0262 family)